VQKFTEIDGFVVDVVNPGDGLDLSKLVRRYFGNRFREVSRNAVLKR
jgi:hypothetical protein